MPPTLIMISQSRREQKKMVYICALVLCSLAGQDGIKGPSQGVLEGYGKGEYNTLSRLSWVSSPYRLYTFHEPKAELF